MSPEPTSLRSVREDTIDELCRRFAADQLSLAELERRLEKARSARTRRELSALTDDLRPAPAARPTREAAARPTRATRPPAPSGGAPGIASSAGVSIPEAASAARPSTRRDAAGRAGQGARPSSHLALAIMGGTRRAGRWVPPSTMTAVGIMGGVELDFRSAVFTSGVVEINCFAFWGAVEIIVPPHVHVDTHGFAFMGGFDQVSEQDTHAAPDAPTIRINGFALMGAVEVKVAEAGEKVRESDY